VHLPFRKDNNGGSETKTVRPERRSVGPESKDERFLFLSRHCCFRQSGEINKFRSSFDFSAARLRSGRTEFVNLARLSVLLIGDIRFIQILHAES